jgi:hypothetical protein
MILNHGEILRKFKKGDAAIAKYTSILTGKF